MTRTNHAKRKGDLTRTQACPFCGGEHRRKSKEQRECRARAKAGKDPITPAPDKPRGEAISGSPSTRYESDGLRGDKRAHGIARKARMGWSERKLAKHFALPVEEIRETLRRAGL